MDEFDHNRVTEILSPFSGVEFVPPELLQNAADRGTAVHRIVEGLIQGFEDDNISETLAPYVRSFKKYWEESEHSFENGEIIQEKRLFCNNLMITGQMDLIIKFEDITISFDWKTSAREHKSWRLQSAAYKYLLEINGFKNVDHLTFIKLSKYGGSPKVFQYKTFNEDLETFQKCLDLYRWFDMSSTRKKWGKR